jgi:hypothetical protein
MHRGLIILLHPLIEPTYFPEESSPAKNAAKTMTTIIPMDRPHTIANKIRENILKTRERERKLIYLPKDYIRSTSSC